MTCVIDMSHKPPVLLCTACEGTAPFSLPMNVSQITAITETFQRQHRECEKKLLQTAFL